MNPATFLIMVVAASLMPPGNAWAADARSDAAITVPAAEFLDLLLSAERVNENGREKGLRVTDEKLARRFGLQSGDVLTQFSGFTVEVARAGKPPVRWRFDDGHVLRTVDLATLLAHGSVQAAPPEAEAHSPRAATPERADDSIEKVDDLHYRGSRRVIGTLIADLDGWGRTVPAFRDGSPDGFKLFALRGTSAVTKLGFRNGDTVHSLNGVMLSSPEAARDLYSKLRDASELKFGLTRDEKQVTLRIVLTK